MVTYDTECIYFYIIFQFFYRTGEYIVEVIMSNLVSSASLTGHIFVVEELCQPPPVKNMGPNKIKVWRYQTVHLAVTFEAQIQCNVSRGLLYRWTIYDMSGRQLLFPHIDMGRQYTDLPKYLLHYGTYKAIAKVMSFCHFTALLKCSVR